MKIEIDNGSGFCFGVTTAIKKAEEELAKGDSQRASACIVLAILFITVWRWNVCTKKDLSPLITNS